MVCDECVHLGEKEGWCGLLESAYKLLYCVLH